MKMIHAIRTALILATTSLSIAAPDSQEKPAGTPALGFQTALLATDAQVEAQAEAATKVFRLMGEAVQKADIELFMETISMDAMIEVLEKATGQKMGKKLRATFIDDFEMYNSQSLIRMGHLVEVYENAEVVRIQVIDANRFIAYTRAWNSKSGSYVKFRYWFCRDSKSKLGYGTYDFEDLNEGLRSSNILSVMMLSQTSELKKWAPIFKQYLAAKKNYKVDKKEYFKTLNALGKKLLSINSVPETVRRMALLSEADQKFLSGDFAGGNTLLDQANQLGGGTPSILRKKAQLYKQQKDYQKSAEMYLKYADFMGFDSEIYRGLALVSEKLDQPEQALKYAKLGLEINSKNLEIVVRYGLLSDEKGRSEVIDIIAKTEKAQQMLFILVQVAAEEQREDAWQWYFNKYKELYQYDKERIELMLKSKKRFDAAHAK